MLHAFSDGNCSAVLGSYRSYWSHKGNDRTVGQLQEGDGALVSTKPTPVLIWTKSEVSVLYSNLPLKILAWNSLLEAPLLWKGTAGGGQCHDSGHEL